MTAYDVKLTDWDCFIIRQAIAAYVHWHYYISINDYFYLNRGHEKHLHKAYRDVLGLHHQVNWSTTTRKAILNDLEEFSSINKIHDRGLNAPYNPHDYRACIAKLRLSLNKKEC